MKILENTWGWLVIFFHGIAEIQPGSLWLWLGIWSLILGSAFAAATIAEVRSRSMFLHFFAGAILPVLYPAFIFRKLPSVQRVVQEKQKEVESEVKVGVNMTMVRVQYEAECKRLAKKGEPVPDFSAWYEARESKKQEQAQEQAQAVVAPVSGISRLFLENLAVDSSGSRKGPFLVKLADGRELTVEQIKNIMDEVAAFEIVDTNGQVKSIRLKYSNIVSFESASGQ